MNIFVLDLNPKICARYHCDKHVVKMIVESCQILSTVHHFYGNNNITYKSCYENHPCVKWAKTNDFNYFWLRDLAYFLCVEYTLRYNKVHKCQDILIGELWNAPFITDYKERTPFHLAMPDEYKVENDVVQSYRNYYNGAKQHILKWKNRNVPSWII